jgi:hypothetical protein
MSYPGPDASKPSPLSAARYPGPDARASSPRATFEARAGAATTAAPPEGAPRRARWMDATTVVLLLVGVFVVLLTAAEPVLRAAGLGAGPARDDEGVTLLAPDPHGAPDPRDIDLHQRGVEDALRHPPAAKDDADSPPSGATRLQRFGVVRRRVSILEQPVPGARSLGDVEPGELVGVVREVGDFALVVHSGEDGALMGWAKKSEIAVR